MKTRFVIIGAGLSGLVAALMLERHGCSDYLILEKSSKAGGLCSTLYKQGFYFDYAGHFLHLDHVWVYDLAAEILSGNLALCSRDSRIYINGNLCHYPFQNNLYGMPQGIIDECLAGFQEARRVFGPPRPALEYASFGQWIDQTLGMGIGKHFMHPYNEKLWTCSTYELNTAWMKDYVPHTAEAEIIKGANVPPDEAQGYNATFFYPRKGGIGSLINTVRERLTRPILYNCSAASINAKRCIVSTHKANITYEHLLFSAPLPYVATIVEDAPAEIREAACRLHAVDVLCLNLGLCRQIKWPFSWVYFPERTFTFFRLGAYSNVMPSTAPSGQSSIYVEIAHRGGDIVTLKRRALEDLTRIGIIRNLEDIVVDQSVNIKGGYVIYNAERDLAVATITDFLTKNNCFGLGRYGRWEYGDMEDSFLHAEKCVSKLL
jgi:protoporphyrinogen oxidase